MMKNVDNDVDGGEWGIVNIIIGESEKKERWEEPGSSNREKNGEKHKSNHPDDEPAGEKTNYYYYYS